MDIVFCVNDGYAKYIAVTICSIFENNRCGETIKIHVLSDGLSGENDKLLRDTVHGYGGLFHLHIIDDSELRKLYSSYWSVYTWYRCYIPHILKGVTRCLYLDADTIVAGSISELFTMPMEGKSIMATIDIVASLERPYERLSFPKSKMYICAGVMVMNLDYWREHKLSDKIIEYAKRNRDILVMPDQDAINVICQDSKIVLPIKYGVQHYFIFNNWFIENYLDEIKEAIVSPKIIHYAGCAPWYEELRVHFMRGYFDLYNRKMGGVVPTIYFLKGFKLFKYRLNDILITMHLRRPRKRYNVPMVREMVDSYNQF